MRALSAVAFVLFAAAAAVAAEQAVPTVYLEVRATRENATYACEEEIAFAVTAFPCTVRGNTALKAADDAKPLTEARTLKYRVTGDHGLDETGEVTLGAEPGIIRTKSAKPGFLLCAVWEPTLTRWWQYRGRGGAAVEPLKIEAGVTKPDDFDAFWADALKDLDAFGLKVIEEKPLDAGNHKDKVDLFAVKLSAPPGAAKDGNPTVCGYLAKPKGAKPKSCPILLNLPGAGLRDPRVDPGMTADLGIIQMSIEVHGFEVGHEKAWYTERRALYQSFSKVPAETKAEALKNSYFRTIFLRVVQAQRYLKSLPEWDGRTFFVTGGSQGGGLTIIATALDPQVSACIASYPGFCDQYGYLKGHANGWPGMIRLGKDGKPEDPMAVETAAYFDAANFATRIAADCAVTCGFVDTTCPPASVYAMFNRIASPKKRMIDGVTQGHAAPPWDRTGFLEAHMARTAEDGR